MTLNPPPRAPQEVQEETQEFLAQMQRKEEEAEAKAQQLAETKRHLQELVERLQAAIIEEELSGPHVRRRCFPSAEPAREAHRRVCRKRLSAWKCRRSAGNRRRWRLSLVCMPDQMVLMLSSNKCLQEHLGPLLYDISLQCAPWIQSVSTATCRTDNEHSMKTRNFKSARCAHGDGVVVLMIDAEAACPAAQAMLLMQKAKTYLKEAEVRVRSLWPDRAEACLSSAHNDRNDSAVPCVCPNVKCHRTQLNSNGPARTLPRTLKRPQMDEAEAYSRVQRWRELKEAVEQLDDKEKRVRSEVPAIILSPRIPNAFLSGLSPS